MSANCVSTRSAIMLFIFTTLLLFSGVIIYYTAINSTSTYIVIVIYMLYGGACVLFLIAYDTHKIKHEHLYGYYPNFNAHSETVRLNTYVATYRTDI